MNGCGQQPGHRYVQEGADYQRTKDADGHVLLGIACFLGCGGNGVETDIRKENNCGASQDARPAVGTERACVGRQKHFPVRVSEVRVLQNEGQRDGDERQHGKKLHEYDGSVKVSGFFDANNEGWPGTRSG